MPFTIFQEVFSRSLDTNLRSHAISVSPKSNLHVYCAVHRPIKEEHLWTNSAFLSSVVSGHPQVATALFLNTPTAFIQNNKTARVNICNVIQRDRNVMQPFPGMFYYSKNKLHWYEKKNNVILISENVYRVQRRMHWFFPSCLMQPAKGFCSDWNGPLDEILSICLARQNREIYPWTHCGKLSKNVVPGSVRQRALVALVKKASSHFNRLKTTDWQARAGYNITWPELAPVQSQRYCVVIKPIELY
jgi:hypothetical protein